MTDRGASRTIQCPAAAISLAATAVLLAATACTPAPHAPVSLSWRFVDGRGCDLAGIVDVVARGAAPEPSPPPTVLVTGGAGYIGAHACKALHQAGFRPVVFDNLVYGHREDVKWGPLTEGSLEDRSALDARLRTQSCPSECAFYGSG